MNASILIATGFGVLALLAGVMTDDSPSAEAGAPVLDLCNGTPEVVAWLAGHGQAPSAGGLEEGSGYLVDVYVSEAEGSWTIVSTSPNRISCIMARGEAWESYVSSPDARLAPSSAHQPPSGAARSCMMARGEAWERYRRGS